MDQERPAPETHSAAQLEAALRDAQSRSAAILNTTVDGIITIDRRGIIASFNPAAERLFGYAAAEVVGRNVNVLMPAPYAVEHDRYLVNYLTTGRARIIGIGREVVGLRKDGGTFPMDLAVSEVRYQPGRGQAGGAGTAAAAAAAAAVDRLFTGIVRDLTDRKRLERELLEVSDREQRRIGQDLHDGLGQQLAGIGFLSKSLENRLAARDVPEAADARQIATLVAGAIGQARALARGLHPVDLKATGLMSALEELAQNVAAMFRVRCAFRCPEPVLLADNAVAVHAYRVAQEAANNAVKHGRAGSVTIALERAGAAGVRLSVEDDGGGIPAMPPAQHRGMGMEIMRYRAALVGGTLVIGQRTVGGGTRVELTFAQPAAGDNGAAPAASAAAAPAAPA